MWHAQSCDQPPNDVHASCQQELLSANMIGLQILLMTIRNYNSSPAQDNLVQIGRRHVLFLL